jgi:hypothetical protein
MRDDLDAFVDAIFTISWLFGIPLCVGWLIWKALQ